MREELYTRRLMVTVLLNTIVVPLFYNFLLVKLSPAGYRGKLAADSEQMEIRLGTPKFNDVNLSAEPDFGAPVVFLNMITTRYLCDTLAYTEEYFLRYILQCFVVIVWIQFSVKPETILKAFMSMLKVNGKNKFKHFLFEINLKNALAISVYSLCLTFSVAVPIITPFAALLFWLAYAFDKYNLLHVYPLDFESNVTTRKTTVCYSLGAVIFFQVAMLALISTMISQRILSYFFVFILI